MLVNLDCQFDEIWNHHKYKSLHASVRDYVDWVN